MTLIFQDLLDRLPQGALWSCVDARSPIYAVEKYNKNCNSDPSSDILYLMSLSEYRKFTSRKNCNLLVYSKEAVSRKALRHDNNAIVVFDKRQLYEISNFVTVRCAMAARLNTISMNMHKCSTSSEPFQSLLNYCFELLMNPIIVTDVSFKCVGKIGADNIYDNEHWNYAVNNGFFSPHYVDLVINKNRKAFEESIGLELIFDDKDKLGVNHNQYSSRIIFKHKVIGFFKLLEYNRPVSEMDKEIIKLAGKFISSVVISQNGLLSSAYSSSIEESFLLSILCKSLTSESEIEERQKAFGLRYLDNYRVIIVKAPAIVMKSDKLQFMISKLSDSFRNIHTLTYNKELVLLSDFRKGGDPFAGKAPDGFAQILDEYDSKAYISQRFNSLVKIPNYYEQARVCCDINNLIGDTSNLCWYTDVIELHVLLHFCKNYDYHTILHPALITLMDYDSDNDTDLVNTMLTVIRSHGNISVASKKLYIHYNTLKYRIEKIVELTGIDFDDPDTLVRILMSDKILMMKNK